MHEEISDAILIEQTLRKTRVGVHNFVRGLPARTRQFSPVTIAFQFLISIKVEIHFNIDHHGHCNAVFASRVKFPVLNGFDGFFIQAHT